MLFSVGVGATDDVVVVVVLDGVGDSVLLQPAVRAPIAMIAPPPATSARRRVRRPEIMISSNLIPEMCQALRARARWLNADVNMMPHLEQTLLDCLIGALQTTVQDQNARCLGLIPVELRIADPGWRDSVAVS
jgi:hypothetical protein